MSINSGDSKINGKPRIRYLDGIRATAAIFVLVHHAFCMAYPINEQIRPEGLTGILFGWAVYGHFGVTVFIALAGYSLTLAVVRRNSSEHPRFFAFMRRRALRIIPPYWAALLLTVILVTTYIGKPMGTHWDQSVPTDRRGWFMDALLLQDIHAFKNAAYPFWSVAVEWHIYLLMPAMLLVRRRKSSWTWAIGFGCTFGLLGMLLSRWDPNFERFYFDYYLIFALAVGMCVAAHQRPSWFIRVSWLPIATAFLGSVIAICIFQPYLWVGSQYYWIDVILGGAVICALGALSKGDAPRLARVLSWRPLAGVGSFSYSLYLVHAPLLAVFWRLVISPMNLARPWELLVMWTAAVPLIVLISYGFYRIAERPFVRLAARSQGQVEARRDSGRSSALDIDLTTPPAAAKELGAAHHSE